MDDVVPATDRLWTTTLQESLELRARASVLEMPEPSTRALAPEGYVQDKNGTIQPLRVLYKERIGPDPRHALRDFKFVHPLVEAVHMAFAEHRPLVFSPDSIWMVIVQGFGHHILENAERLRRRIVSHEGKRVLEVKTGFLRTDWPSAIAQFSSLIRANSDPVLHETLVCKFSTTTPDITTAYEIALMDAYQRYFEYHMGCICGIPNITVEGTPDDWQRIRERLEVLATFDLAWWTTRLAPILDQFVAAANGAPDRNFWQAIYKPRTVYFSQLATGWITYLFPYLSGHHALHRNLILDEKEIHWSSLSAEGSKSAREVGGISLNSFPSGISRAPLTLKSPFTADKNIYLMGGFFGIAQRDRDNALAPILSWAAVDNPA